MHTPSQDLTRPPIRCADRRCRVCAGLRAKHGPRATAALRLLQTILLGGVVQSTAGWHSDRGVDTGLGSTVFLVHSPAIAMVDVQIDFDAGARRDPADKPGLANLMASSTAYGVWASADAPALDETRSVTRGPIWALRFGGTASADRMTFARVP